MTDPYINKKINWRSRIVKTGKIRADQITPHPNNPRKHPAAQREAVEASFDVLGQIAPIVINVNNGYLVDGEERSWLALSQGDDAELDAVWVDLSDDEHLLALTTFDWLTQMAVYDRDSLDTLLQQVNTDNAALQSLLSELAEAQGVVDFDETPPGDPGAAIDRATELRDKYGVERNQVWIVGRHRIMCGDAYSETDRARLLNDKTPDMLHIDPPYGINIVKPENGSLSAADGGAKAFGSTGETKRKGISAVAFRNGTDNIGRVAPANIIQSNLYPVIQGDDRPFDPSVFIDLAPMVIMWGANYYADKLPSRACWICWDKREDITRNNFADGELAWTNQNSPMRIFYHLWNGLHKGSQHGERRTHPTEKPVALFAEIGKSYADQGVWLDLFAGTGAQVVAAEQTGATCYANEIEPLYIATILERLSQMGLTPELAT